MHLPEFFTNYPQIAIAFSGGADSAYLLYMAKKYAKDVTAFYVSTAFQPEFEKQDAIQICREYDIPLTILEYDILQHSQIVSNPHNRCYYCKTALFQQIKKAAKDAGYSYLADGTNASDDADDRPGMKALKELQVLSPLRLCGITKEQLREESKKLGLFTAEKPAYACLATRIPTHTPITHEQLETIETVETQLSRLGFQDFRARLLADGVKLQVKKAQFPLILEKKEEILQLLQPYFSNIYLDLKSR